MSLRNWVKEEGDGNCWWDAGGYLKIFDPSQFPYFPQAGNQNGKNRTLPLLFLLLKVLLLKEMLNKHFFNEGATYYILSVQEWEFVST